jgi:hypothetical protein
MGSPKLFMMMLGCTPQGRNTEQHDMYFTIASSIGETVQEIKEFWPEANGNIHIDAWREVSRVNEFRIEVRPKETAIRHSAEDSSKLFFINLGGYKENEFDEFHYKLLIPALDKASAIKEAKLTAFYKHTRFKGAESHIDDKFGVDVDEIYELQDILPAAVKSRYSITVTPQITGEKDEIHLGYFKLADL